MVDSVTQSDMYLSSRPLADSALERTDHHFCLFNLNYIATTRTVDAEKRKATPPGALILTPFDETLGVTITRAKDEKRYQLDGNFYTVDEVVFDINNRFKLRPFESLHFDFGEVMVADRYPTEEDIKAVIQKAMEAVRLTGNRLSLENKKQIDNYFNQFLPPGTKKRVFENIEGDLTPTATHEMDKHSLRLSELDKDATAFLSEDYGKELSDDNKTVLEFLSEWRGGQKDETQLLLPMFEADPFVMAHSDIIRSLVANDTRSPYAVNTSRLKNPQSIILVSHHPEREFVFRLIDHADYIDAWIKSPDKGFYSIHYEFWRGGKDRTRRGFNPDFFIKCDLDRYLAKLAVEGQTAHLEALKNLQDGGVEYLIRVVEIKSDDDDDEATPAKDEYAGAHFEKLNQRLRAVNIADIPKKYRPDARQHYTFDLLRPALFGQWFSSLRKGRL